MGQSLSGLALIDGKIVNNNETTRPGVLLRNGQPSTVIVSVLKDSITVTCDDQRIIHWKGDSTRLSLNSLWSVPNKRALFIGSSTSYHISKIVLTPISGQGQVLKE